MKRSDEGDDGERRQATCSCERRRAPEKGQHANSGPPCGAHTLLSRSQRRGHLCCIQSSVATLAMTMANAMPRTTIAARVPCCVCHVWRSNMEWRDCSTSAKQHSKRTWHWELLCAESIVVDGECNHASHQRPCNLQPEDVGWAEQQLQQVQHVEAA